VPKGWRPLKSAILLGAVIPAENSLLADLNSLFFNKNPLLISVGN
jgi:hypothetical protein